jgi:hypothetical protein
MRSVSSINNTSIETVEEPGLAISSAAPDGNPDEISGLEDGKLSRRAIELSRTCVFSTRSSTTSLPGEVRLQREVVVIKLVPMGEIISTCDTRLPSADTNCIAGPIFLRVEGIESVTANTPSAKFFFPAKLTGIGVSPKAFLNAQKKGLDRVGSSSV